MRYEKDNYKKAKRGAQAHTCRLHALGIRNHPRFLNLCLVYHE